MINDITLRNFRNHSNINLRINNNFVYITGPNGSGKTSILEAIYLISTTKSHRTNKDADLIKTNEPFSHVKIKTNNHMYDLIVSEKGKLTRIDNKEIGKLSEFIGKLKVVMFAPEDLSLIKGSPAIRRSFIDIELMKLDQRYLDNLSKYRNILKQRNALLKKLKLGDDLIFLNILGNQLYETGVTLMKDRSKFINRLNKEVASVYKLFSEYKIEMTYAPNINEIDFRNYLNNNQKQDIIYKTTINGPHRDDFNITFNGFDAKSYASQGQVRLIAIAMKLALLNVIRSVSGNDVVLLLDDVLSELDESVQKRFLDHLPADIQIIMNSAIKIENKNMQIIELGESRIWKIKIFMTRPIFKY